VTKWRGIHINVWGHLSPPPGERCFVHSISETFSDDLTHPPKTCENRIVPETPGPDCRSPGDQRRRGGAGVAASISTFGATSVPRRGSGASCVKWLELWRDDKAAALSSAVFDCRTAQFAFT
jgi:hypothetical protein